MLKKKPKIIFMSWGALNYIECGDEEPTIEDDRVGVTAAIHLSHGFASDDFTMNLYPFSDGTSVGDEVISIPAVIGERRRQDSTNRKTKILHFIFEDLQCFSKYCYEILYNGTPVALMKFNGNKHEYGYSGLINTPPARRDPRPIRFAAGGDQEWHEQLGLIGKALSLDNHKKTRRIYKHIARRGDITIPVDAPIDNQPYSMFIHLGDMFNGEMYFSLTNLIRRGRHIFEPYVKRYEAFKFHFNTDCVNIARNTLAQKGYGTYAVLSDHDVGHNGQNEPETEREKKTRVAVQDVFHEELLLPNFLEQEHDGYGSVTTKGREGPYYKLRVGRIEWFFLHCNYTQKTDAEDRSYLLGEAQWQWLEASLRESKADKKILVSPLPFVMGKNPNEDFRARWQEWERGMQLCRECDVRLILTADTHNLSHSRIAVRQYLNDNPHYVNQLILGTMGGAEQHVTADEQQSIELPGRPPLLPSHPDFDAELYRGSSVISHFVPNQKKALLPILSLEEWDGEGAPTDSQWTKKGEWDKGTFGYGGFDIVPIIEPDAPLEAKLEKLDWQTTFNFFACSNKKRKIDEEQRLQMIF